MEAPMGESYVLLQELFQSYGRSWNLGHGWSFHERVKAC
jgi:hypothetical protein